MNTLHYLDGNAVTYLWEQYVSYKKQGRTVDDLSLSPFNSVVLSEYTISEFLTIPISDTYKKHLLFVSMFPSIPVFRSITEFSKDKLNAAEPKDLLASPNFLSSVGHKRAKALIFQQDLMDLIQDIQDKKNGQKAAELFLNRDTSGNIVYVDPKSRININDVIERICKVEDLKPALSRYDFYMLCMHLYVATRERLVDVPAKFRKGPKQMLNHQIDFYHLSYLPFVGNFITDDEYLRIVAEEVVRYFNLKTKISDSSKYWTSWLDSTLTDN